ncbi:hypothetical protein HHL26_03330 [Sphingobium sp. TB-6]|uniref:hypothetical protein n=1 Tax=Sphingobium sp. TB-6 TaxID=2728850 RepID=UPI00146E6F58|nr:hypothetical protein [Sphingobium sp. TB-6]NML88103.1 hypothetical protein [Sphingobium sp. TB-6]
MELRPDRLGRPAGIAWRVEYGPDFLAERAGIIGNMDVRQGDGLFEAAKRLGRSDDGTARFQRFCGFEVRSFALDDRQEDDMRSPTPS